MEAQSTSNELATIPTKEHALVLFTGGLDAALKDIETQAKAAVAGLDISTPAGRKAIASAAYKVAKSKTAIDGLGKELVAETKAKVAAIDEERRRAWAFLEGLQGEIRKPLTEFEENEAKRIAAHEANIAMITVTDDPQTIEIADLWLAKVESFRPLDWEEFQIRAYGVIEESVKRITAAKDRMVKAAEQAAELARLRAEAERREREDRERRIAEEAAARAKAEAERKAQEEAEKAARIAAEAAAKAEQDKIEAAKKAKADQEAAIQRERERVEAEARRKAQDEAKRQADQANRDRIHAEVLDDMAAACSTEGSSEIVRDIAQALIAGRIRNVKVVY